MSAILTLAENGETGALSRKCKMKAKEMCRTCLHESHNLIPIHDIKLTEGNNSTTVPALIEFCFKLEVLLDDGLPQNICVRCADALKGVYEFQVRCYKSAHKLGMQTGNQNILANLEKAVTGTINMPFNAKQGLHNSHFNSHSQLESNEVHDSSSLEHNYATEAKISKFCSSNPLFYQIVRKADPSTCLTYNGYANDAEDDSNAESDLDYNEFMANVLISRYCQTDIKEICKLRKKAEAKPRCPACDYKCRKADRRYLTKHILRNHTSGRDCQICMSKDIRFLTAHCESHLPERYFCTLCDKGFAKNEHFLFHKKMAREILFECDTCLERFCLETDYNWHMKRHELQENSPRQIIKCCGREFLGADEFNKHKLNSHGPKKIFKCVICSEIFTTRLEYSKHKATHPRVRKRKDLLLCPVCDRKFICQDRLLIHKRRKHPEIYDDNEIQLKRCKICFFVCKSKNTLYAHETSHAETTQMYCCKLCDRSYKKKGSLQTHIQAFHSNLRRYRCNLCNKDFRYPGNLSTHRRSKGHKETLKAKSNHT